MMEVHGLSTVVSAAQRALHALCLCGPDERPLMTHPQMPEQPRERAPSFLTKHEPFGAVRQQLLGDAGGSWAVCTSG